VRKTAGYTSTEYKTNTETAKELNSTPVLDKIQEYRINWLQYTNSILSNRLPRILKKLQTNRQKKLL